MLSAPAPAMASASVPTWARRSIRLLFQRVEVLENVLTKECRLPKVQIRLSEALPEPAFRWNPAAQPFVPRCLSGPWHPPDELDAQAGPSDALVLQSALASMQDQLRELLAATQRQAEWAGGVDRLLHALEAPSDLPDPVLEEPETINVFANSAPDDQGSKAYATATGTSPSSTSVPRQCASLSAATTAGGGAHPLPYTSSCSTSTSSSPTSVPRQVPGEGQCQGVRDGGVGRGRADAQLAEQPVGVPASPDVERAAAAKAEGNAAFQANNFVEAVKHYTAAIGFDSSDHVFFSNRSACYAALEQFEKALEDGRECVRLCPTWPKGYARKGLAELSLMRYCDAAETYRRGLMLAPKDSTLSEGLREAVDAERTQHDLWAACGMEERLSSCDNDSSASSSDGYWSRYNAWYASLNAHDRLEEDCAIENGCTLFEG